MRMHLISAAALAVLASAAMTGHAEAASRYPFCAVAGGYGGYENCGYPSFAACQAAVSGVGGHCRPNPRYEGYAQDYDDEAPPPRRARRGYRPY